MKPLHMCTIAQALAELREAGCTTVGETALRRWIREGRFAYVRSGKRILINMDSLEKFLSEGMEAQQTPPPSPAPVGSIRQVPERLYIRKAR